MEKWDGLRLEVSKALRVKTGFRVILRYDRYPRALLDAIKRAKVRRVPAPVGEPRSGGHAGPGELFKAYADRIPGLAIEDRTEAVAKLRSIKSKNEVAMIQRGDRHHRAAASRRS